MYTVNKSSLHQSIVFGIILIIGIQLRGSAQVKHTEDVEQIWTGYFNQTRFSKKWGGWLDFQLRTANHFVNNISQMIIRPGITYYNNEEMKLTAGYAYVMNFSNGQKNQTGQPEHRLWQQLQWLTKFSKVRTTQRFRLEERYRKKSATDSTIAQQYHFNYRLRYQFQLQIPLAHFTTSKRDFSFILSDELFVNFGKQILYNYFDQNRFFAGFSYQLNPHDNLQLGYMNLFQQLSKGSDFRSLQVARIYYLHNIDLQGKNKL